MFIEGIGAVARPSGRASRCVHAPSLTVGLLPAQQLLDAAAECILLEVLQLKKVVTVGRAISTDFYTEVVEN